MKAAIAAKYHEMTTVSNSIKTVSLNAQNTEFKCEMTTEYMNVRQSHY